MTGLETVFLFVIIALLVVAIFLAVALNRARYDLRLARQRAETDRDLADSYIERARQAQERTEELRRLLTATLVAVRQHHGNTAMLLTPTILAKAERKKVFYDLDGPSGIVSLTLTKDSAHNDETRYL